MTSTRYRPAYVFKRVAAQNTDHNSKQFCRVNIIFSSTKLNWFAIRNVENTCWSRSLTVDFDQIGLRRVNNIERIALTFKESWLSILKRMRAVPFHHPHGWIGIIF